MTTNDYEKWNCSESWPLSHKCEWGIPNKFILCHDIITNEFITIHNVPITESVVSVYCIVLDALSDSGRHWVNQPTNPVHGNVLPLLNWDLCKCPSVVLPCISLSTLCFSWSHKCSIGFKSGEQAGNSMTVIQLCVRWFTTALAVWTLALSRRRIKFCPTCWPKGVYMGR